MKVPGLKLNTIRTHEIGSRAAIKLRDTALSPEAVEASLARGLAGVKRFISENEQGYANFRKQTRGSSNNLRVISDVGFRELTSVGLKQRGSGVPTFSYKPPPVDAVLKRPGDAPMHCFLHSFGGGWDKQRLKQTKSAKSVAVDPDTGFNPLRFFRGVSTLLKPGDKKKVSIHHIVSRRGDLVNSVSWDEVGYHAGGPKARQLGINTNISSIGIEMEEWFVRETPGKNVHGIIDRAPYTEEQIAVIAFILKKLTIWNGTPEMLRWLGPATQGLKRLGAGDPGCLNHRASAVSPGEPAIVEGDKERTGHFDPGAQWFFPQGFRKGDPIPDHLRHRRGAYERWINRWYEDVPNGTVISGWDRLFSKVNRIRSFDLQKEVFDQTRLDGRIKVVTPTVTGAGGVAAAQMKSRDRLAGVDRAERMQNTPRSGFYSRAQQTNSATAAVWAEHNSRLTDAANKTMRLPVIVNAVGFDFSTGKWVNKTTEIVPKAEKIQERAEDIEEARAEAAEDEGDGDEE